MLNRRNLPTPNGGLDILDSHVETESMSRVREEYGKLKDVMKTLNTKLSGVLAKQESEFLAAYRSHMYNVQKDLAALRQKVLEAEMALQKNEKVQKLEEDCEWYRSEAIRLDGFATAMKKDLKYMKDKLEVLEEERSWYAKQLKASKRQTRLLLAELDLKRASTANPAGESNNSANGDDKSQAGESESDKSLHQRFNGLGFSVDYMSRMHPQNHMNVGYRTAPTKHRPGSLKQLQHKGLHHSHSAQGTRLPPPFSSEAHDDASTGSGARQWTTPSRYKSAPELMSNDDGQEQWHGADVHPGHLEAEVRALKRQLAAEKRTSSQLRSGLVQAQMSKSELEEFFLAAVEDVKREIERRRRKQGAERKSVLEDRATTREVVLEEFTAPDRVSTILKTLSQRGALETLHRSLFAPSAEQEVDEGKPTRARAGPMPQLAERKEPGAEATASAGGGEGGGGGLVLQQSTIEYLSGKGLPLGGPPHPPLEQAASIVVATS